MNKFHSSSAASRQGSIDKVVIKSSLSPSRVLLLHGTGCERFILALSFGISSPYIITQDWLTLLTFPASFEITNFSIIMHFPMTCDAALKFLLTFCLVFSLAFSLLRLVVSSFSSLVTQTLPIIWWPSNRLAKLFKGFHLSKFAAILLVNNPL